MKHLGRRVQAMTNDYNEAKALLKEVKEAEASKKKSLFSRIKKHVDMYENNKDYIAPPSAYSRASASAPVKATTMIRILSSIRKVLSRTRCTSCAAERSECITVTARNYRNLSLYHYSVNSACSLMRREKLMRFPNPTTHMWRRSLPSTWSPSSSPAPSRSN